MPASNPAPNTPEKQVHTMGKKEHCILTDINALHIQIFSIDTIFHQTYSSRADLKDMPMENAEWDL